MKHIAKCRHGIRFILAGLLIIAGSQSVQAQQDTLYLSPKAAQQQFLQANLSLLAARYNIDVNRALIRQAGYLDNPVLSTDQNIYDGQDGFFKHNNTGGQVYVQLMQLIRTAGKRSKAVQLAADNASLSEAQFDDLVRNLNYTLAGDLLELEHQLKISRVYEAELVQIEQLSAAMDKQLASGSISQKEALRIKALLFSVQNDKASADAQVIPLQNEIRLFINSNSSRYINPRFAYALPDVINYKLPLLDTLVQQALRSRPDAQIAKAALAHQSDNLIYQKALAKPDVSVGAEYDQRSSYAPDYVGLAVSLPLTVFNRNRGNIAAARASVQQQQTQVSAQAARIRTDVVSAYERVLFYQGLNNKAQLSFAQQYEAMFKNMLSSYQQRQISLLEFIDFADAYKDARLKILEQHTGLLKALQDLNFAIGREAIDIIR